MGKVKPVNMGMVFGKIDVECAKFDIVSEGKAFQVRRYHPAVAAQVKTTDDNGGFRQLARYIGVFGTPENGSNQAVSMTAPVVSTPQSISMTAPVTSTTDTMQFILPSVLSMENAPKPASPDVELVQLPSRTYAVRQYSGSTTIEETDSGDGHNTTQNASGCWMPNLARTCPNNATGGWAASGTGHTHQCPSGCYKAAAADC